VEDWENRTILDRVEELVTVPARGQWTRLALSVSDNRESDSLRVIEDSAECV
jgi:hypothetical protein